MLHTFREILRIARRSWRTRGAWPHRFLTYTPRPWITYTKPSSASTRTAFLAVSRAMPCSCISRDPLGIARSGTNSPRPVLLGVLRAAHIRQQPEAAPPPGVDLPQPVPRDLEARRPERVVGARRVDVRDTPRVGQDLGRRLEPGHGHVGRR